MFSTETFIDAVQLQKKWFVNSHFTDAEVRNSLCDFVDKQTAFVKQVVKTNELIAQRLLGSFKV